MKRETKRAPVTHTQSPSLPSLLLGWAKQGFDSFLATQKILMDFATGKTSGAIKNLREGLADPEHSPIAILTELAVEATSNLTEAQRILLNLAQEENEIVMKGVKERVSGSETALAVTERVRRAINTLVELEQDYLTTASKHMQKRLEATKAGKGPDVACLVDAARDGMQDFVRAQKKFLDLVVTDGAKSKATHAEDVTKKTELTKLAREAAESFIDAQKNLLDLAGQQVNVTLQTTSRAAEMVGALRPQLLPKFTGEGVKNFVEAEKELITSMMKPAEAEKAPQKRVRAAKRPVRRRKTEAVAAASTGA